MSDYQAFLRSKARLFPPSGFDPPALSGHLYRWQADITRWALRRGRACIFAATGCGKTRMLAEYSRRVANYSGGRVLILAPLAVSAQTVAEAAKMGIEIRRCQSQDDVRSGVSITNYDRLHLFDPSAFVGIVLDESSCIKGEDSKTRAAIFEGFRETPYRLALSATPAPNEYRELGQHAEFMGAMSAQEMLATFFAHDSGDTQKWTLKGHARRAFWRWLSSFACMVRRPSDLGYEDGDYILPPLHYHEHIVEADGAPEGFLFPIEAATLQERIGARRASVAERVAECAALVNGSEEEWLVWAHLNAESSALAEAIPGSVEVRGSDSREFKEQAMLDFAAGRIKTLISKGSICGHGMNFQVCRNVAFVGIGDSWEEFHQSIRRCWRYQQKRPVHVHVIYARTEGAVLANLKRKEAEAAAMGEEMAREAGEFVRAEVTGLSRTFEDYIPTVTMELPSWLKTG